MTWVATEPPQSSEDHTVATAAEEPFEQRGDAEHRSDGNACEDTAGAQNNVLKF